MEAFNELSSTILNAREDALKFFEKGNAVAGTRLRKAMQTIKNTAQAVRIQVAEAKAAGKEAPKVPKAAKAKTPKAAPAKAKAAPAKKVPAKKTGKK